MVIINSSLPVVVLLALCSQLLAVGDEAAQAAGQRLLTAKTGAELRAASAAAVGTGLPKQAVAEAKLMFGIRTEDLEVLRGAVRDLEAASMTFDPQDSIAGLSTVEQFRGLLCYGKAIMALDAGEEGEFRDLVLKGFWLFPEQGGMFGKAAARFQTQERMANLTVDFSSPLIDTEGKETTLADLMGSSRAVVLYFWSDAGGAAAEGLLGLMPLVPRLKKHGLGLIGINTSAKNADIAARDFNAVNKLPIPLAGEPSGRGLARLVEATGSARLVVVSERGRIVFNGSPNDPGLWRAVKALVPSFEIPTLR